MKLSKLFLFSILILFSIYSASAAIDLMGLTLDVKEAGLDVESGNISIEIYDAPTGGSLIYNSSNSFNDNITNGKVDIMLGSDSSGVELNLTYGATYYMDLNVNGNDIDYNGIERQEFQSTVGNITQARLNLTDTLYTNSLIPYANLSFDLGSAENYFRNAYFQTLTLVNTLDSGNISDVYLFNTGDTATGDYTFDSPTLHIDSGNNFVGIRTTTPGNALNVAGDGNFTGTLWVGGTQITADSNVSGGGTTNYLVKFLAETTIGNSLIYDDGTLVGIDTISPQGKLEISNSTTLNVPWINVTDGAGGIKFVLDNAGRVGIGRYPSEMFEVLGAGLFTANLTVQGIADVGNLITDFINTTHLLDRTLLSDDLADSSINTTLVVDRTLLADDLADSSVNTTHILDRTLLADDLADGIINDTHLSAITINTTHILDRTLTADDLADSSINTTHIAANTILEEDLGFSVLLRTDNLAFTNESNTFSVDQNFGINATIEDSLLLDYIFPQNETFTRIDNITILQDLRVLGSSYLSSFTIGNDLLIGQSNISSTFVGLGTSSPIFPLHINFTDSGNNTITELLALERTNSSDAISNGYGSSILFRLQDDTGEVENISQIAGILDNVGNGTERGALVFYTGYGDQNGIISNLSSAEAVRIEANKTLTIKGDLAVTGASYLGSLTFTDNGTFPDSILTDFIYPESSGNIALMGGNVGIGTTAPASRLHAVDTSQSNQAEFEGNNAQILLNSTTTGSNKATGIKFAHDTGTKWGIGPDFGSGVGNSNLEFYDYMGTAGVRLVIQNTSGNVGIGTTAPGLTAGITRALTISGVADGDVGAVEIQGNRSSAGSGTGVLGFYNSNNGIAEIRVERGTNANDGQMTLRTASGGTLNSAFFINSAGNVGIGTTTPNFKLEVAGDTSLGSALTQNLTVTADVQYTPINLIPNSGVEVDSDANGWPDGYTASTCQTNGAGTGLSLVRKTEEFYGTVGNETNVWDVTQSTGGHLISTTLIPVKNNTDYVFSFNVRNISATHDSFTFAAETFDSDSVEVTNDITSGLSWSSYCQYYTGSPIYPATSDGGWIKSSHPFKTGPNTHFIKVGLGGITGGIEYRTDNWALYEGTASHPYSPQGGNVNLDRLTAVLGVDTNGNVGIGTTSPTQPLNVIGDANITGDLYVHGQNMTAPDYVFESYYGDGSLKEGKALSNYNLMPLKELSNYIKQNKQLPPSVIQGNFTLEGGDNNIVRQQYYLLEKAEEQSIYIIQLNNAIQESHFLLEKEIEDKEKIKQELKQQQKQIEKLNKRIEALEADK